MRIFLKLALTLVLSTQFVLPQQSKPRSDSEVAAITARGRMLAEYDVASRYATDEVVGLKPAHGVVAPSLSERRHLGRQVPHSLLLRPWAEKFVGQVPRCGVLPRG